MKISVRHSLIAIALLGAITCVVSTVALTRLIQTTNAQRIERAHDMVAQQLELLRGADGTLAAAPAFIGTRGGVLLPGSSIDAIVPPVDAATNALLVRALANSATSGAIAIEQSPLEDTTLLVGAVRTARGAIAWTTYPVAPARWINAWRIIGLTLGFAGLLLMVTSVHLAVSVQRGAKALKASLASLGRDLGAPVPRPLLRELADVANGIASLAAELSQAQREQSRFRRELAEQERLAALGRVAAGVAHEVRNPLASIKLRLDLARLEAEASPALVRELASASDEITRLDRIVADLLTVAGRRTGPRVAADLGALASQRIDVVKPWARERGVSIAVRGRADVSVDVDAVGRVIDNLVKNAVEASQPNGNVLVVVAPEARGARVTVSDHGAGVAPERAHELFEPFFTTKQEGTGLGLAVSRAIASAHGGTLTYQRQGDATAFELTLPEPTAAA